METTIMDSFDFGDDAGVMDEVEFDAGMGLMDSGAVEQEVGTAFNLPPASLHSHTPHCCAPHCVAHRDTGR